MKKLAALLLLAASLVQAQTFDAEFRQLFAAAPFQQCVQNTTRVAVQQLRARPPASDVSAIEGVAWNLVLDKCERALINDEVLKLLIVHYKGNEQRAVDFRDGLLWYARAFVLQAVSESRKGVTTQ